MRRALTGGARYLRGRFFQAFVLRRDLARVSASICFHCAVMVWFAAPALALRRAFKKI